MKKIFLSGLITMFLLSLFLSGCGDSTATISTAPPSSTPVATPSPTASAAPSILPSSTPTSAPKASETSAPQADAKQAAPAKQQASAADTKGDMVWISGSGKRYHSSSTCSNMKSPKQISKSDAIAKGLTACSKCY